MGGTALFTNRENRVANAMELASITLMSALYAPVFSNFCSKYIVATVAM